MCTGAGLVSSRALCLCVPMGSSAQSPAWLLSHPPAHPRAWPSLVSQAFLGKEQLVVRPALAQSVVLDQSRGQGDKTPNPSFPLAGGKAVVVWREGTAALSWHQAVTILEKQMCGSGDAIPTLGTILPVPQLPAQFPAQLCSCFTEKTEGGEAMVKTERPALILSDILS